MARTRNKQAQGKRGREGRRPRGSEPRPMPPNAPTPQPGDLLELERLTHHLRASDEQRNRLVARLRLSGAATWREIARATGYASVGSCHYAFAAAVEDLRAELLALLPEPRAAS